LTKGKPSQSFLCLSSKQHTQKKFAHAKEICTRKRNLHTQKKFASKKLESIGVQVHSLDNRDHSKKKTEKKEKAEKEKETRSQSQILPTYHSFIYPSTNVLTDK
jgi:hypothetical protein